MQEVELKKPALFLATVTLISSVFVLEGSGGEKQTLTVRALSYRAIPHERTSYYQTQGQSSTSCYGSGTDLGYSTSISLNCQTVTTPPENIPITVRSLEVYNLVEANGMIYTITCTAHWVGSNCTWLIPGDTFQAEVKDTTMWITARKGGNMGKKIRPKFRILDMRSK
jgi:hypothetical protein